MPLTINLNKLTKPITHPSVRPYLCSIKPRSNNNNKSPQLFTSSTSSTWQCILILATPICSPVFSVRIHRRTHRRICWPSRTRLLPPPSRTTRPGSASTSAAPPDGSSACRPDQHTTQHTTQRGRHLLQTERSCHGYDTVLLLYHTVRRISYCHRFIRLSIKEQQVARTTSSWVQTIC